MIPDANTIVDSTNTEHIALVNVLVKNVFDCMGLTIESNVLSSMTSVVLFAIKQRFRGITFEDVQNALRIGLGGAYGEVFKVNAPALCSWIEHYWQETANERIAKRAAENKANGAKAIDATSTMTVEEHMAHNKNLTNSLYQSFLKGEERLLKLYEFAYDYLTATGQFKPTQTEKNAAWQQAAAEIATNGGHVEKNIFRQQVENSNKYLSQISKAKQLLVLQCFAKKQKANE